VHKSVWIWKELYPLIMLFCLREGVSFNRLVNLSVQGFLGECRVEEVRLKAKIAALLKEETELRRVSSCILRSGSYLPGYAYRVLKEPKERPFSFLPDSQRPLKALDPEEEKVFRKICTRRDEFAQEITDLQGQLFKDVKPFKLDPEPRSKSFAIDNYTPVNNVREKRSDVHG
jgi:hypothetical protein